MILLNIILHERSTDCMNLIEKEFFQHGVILHGLQKTSKLKNIKKNHLRLAIFKKNWMSITLHVLLETNCTHLFLWYTIKQQQQSI